MRCSHTNPFKTTSLATRQLIRLYLFDIFAQLAISRRRIMSQFAWCSKALTAWLEPNVAGTAGKYLFFSVLYQVDAVKICWPCLNYTFRNMTTIATIGLGCILLCQCSWAFPSSNYLDYLNMVQNLVFMLLKMRICSIFFVSLSDHENHRDPLDILFFFFWRYVCDYKLFFFNSCYSWYFDIDFFLFPVFVVSVWYYFPSWFGLISPHQPISHFEGTFLKLVLAVLESWKLFYHFVFLWVRFMSTKLKSQMGRHVFSASNIKGFISWGFICWETDVTLPNLLFFKLPFFFSSTR